MSEDVVPPPIDPALECTYCGTTECDHKHGNGHGCCGNCCATHGGMATDKVGYAFVKSIVRNKNRILGCYLAALRENRDLKRHAPRWIEQEKGSTHWEGCWQDHRNCALSRIAELERENREKDDKTAHLRIEARDLREQVARLEGK